MPRENLSNHKRRNDELPIPEEFLKPSVHDEKDQISNNYKQTDDKNLLSKGSKRESNEDESKEVTDADGIPRLIQIKNRDRKKLKLERLALLNAFFADTSEPDLLYRFEKEEKEKEQQRENYHNMQSQDNAEEAQIDAKGVDKAI